MWLPLTSFLRECLPFVGELLRRISKGETPHAISLLLLEISKFVCGSSTQSSDSLSTSFSTPAPPTESTFAWNFPKTEKIFSLQAPLRRLLLFQYEKQDPRLNNYSFGLGSLVNLRHNTQLNPCRMWQWCISIIQGRRSPSSSGYQRLISRFN